MKEIDTESAILEKAIQIKEIYKNYIKCKMAQHEEIIKQIWDVVDVIKDN